MRTLVATALLAYANADETSLMQDLVKRSESKKLSASADAGSSRQDTAAKLLDTAVNMIKNGVTPDVITFVDATNQDIDTQVLDAIQTEHDRDQRTINDLCTRFDAAIDKLTQDVAQIESHDYHREAAQTTHHQCRADEALACAKSRRCEEQLRVKWNSVKHEESVMREAHGKIHMEWCVQPPFVHTARDENFNLVIPDDVMDRPAMEDWLTHVEGLPPFNWAQTSPYPILDFPQDVIDFRRVSVEYFNAYTLQKPIVEQAWIEYNTKLEECADLEEIWELKGPECDIAQNLARDHACSHAADSRAAREEFGSEWASLIESFWRERERILIDEQERKNEWETLKIVQCLLDHVHSSVITSIETGGPCPTVDSDPEGVRLAIEDCHIVQRGCDPTSDSWTHHLCLDWCDWCVDGVCTPPLPPLPPVVEPACTPTFVAQEQSAFLAAIQSTYATDLAENGEYTDPAGVAHGIHADWPFETSLSAAGWAGCAPPLVCVDCAGQQPEEPCASHTDVCRDPGLDPVLYPQPDKVDCACHIAEQYLSPGQSNLDTFRCLDGTCISQAGRCNGVQNCDDHSDETGCDLEDAVFVPAYLATSYTCPANQHSDVHFQCANGDCIDKVGMCNGVVNCGDGSDEGAHCRNAHDLSGNIHVSSVEATSGRTITVESAQIGASVFHDREYTFNDLGYFEHKTMIKYSNDDKHTSHAHVMTKIRIEEPVTVYIVSLHRLPWLGAQGFTESSHAGVSFSGQRQTKHKEWAVDNDEPNPPAGGWLTTDHFEAGVVYSKNVEAGLISIPGNGGGDGSFLIFMDHLRACDSMANKMVQGCNNNPREIEHGCNVADVRCCSDDGACISGEFPQTFTFLDAVVSQGSACQAGACNGVADRWCHSAVSFHHAHEICSAEGKRLCTRAEIADDTCCGTGCSHDGHLIWVSDE